MHSINNNFRYEKKFILNSIYKHRMLYLISTSKLKFIKQYNPRIVNSIYLDTCNLTSYFDNINGLSARKKFRIRWYNNNNLVTTPNLEIKIKKGHIGEKLIYPIETNLDLTKLTSYKKIVKDLNDIRIPNNVKNTLKMLNTSLYVKYTRYYFISRILPIRLTLDEKINFIDLNRISIRNQKYVNNSNNIIIELKYPQNLDTKQFNDLLQLPLRVSRNSKYITGINQTNNINN